MAGKKKNVQRKTKRQLTWLAMAPFAGLLLSPIDASAAVVTWNNSTGTDFNNGANWAGTAPGGGDIATFTGAAAVQPDLSDNITVSGVNFSNTLSSGYNLTSTSGILTLLSTTLTAANAAISAANTSGSNTISAGIFLGATTGSTQMFTQVTGGTLVFNGTISGGDATSTLRFADVGTYVLNAANTYTGTTFQSAGNTLILGNSAALGTSILRFGSTSGKIQASTNLTGDNKITNAISLASNPTINSGSAIEFSGDVNMAAGARTITNNNAAGVIFGGTISNDNGAGLTFAGSGITTVSGSNLYTGNTAISGGTVVVTTIGDAGATGNLGKGSTINMSGGTLRYGGAGESTNRVIAQSASVGISTTGATGPLTIASNFTASGSSKVLTLSGDGVGYINGNIAEVSTAAATGLTKSGTGTWVVSSGNTFSGTVLMVQGKLGAGGDNSLGKGAISWDQNYTGELFATTDVVLANRISFQTAAASTTIAGVVNGDHSITVSGGLSVGSNAGSAGTKLLTNDIISGKALTINGTVTFGGSGSSGTTWRIAGAGNTVINANLQTGGTGKVTYVGTGSLTLAGDNNQAGTLTLGGTGTVNLNSATATGAGGISIAGAAINNTSGGAVTLSGGNNITFSADTAFFKPGGTSANNLTFGAGTVDPGGSRGFTINGSGTTLSFGGAIAAQDTSRILTVTGAGNKLSVNGISITTLSGSNRTFTITGNADVDVTAAIVGTSLNAGALTYSGSGTLKLTGANTYNGTTTVNGGGKLIINSTQGTGNIAVSNGSTFGGIGTVAAVSVAAGSLSTVTPGNNGTGILNTGNFALRDNNLAIEVGKALTHAGSPPVVSSEYDQVKVTGTVTLNNSTISGANLALSAPATGIEVGDVFFIVANDLTDNVTGTFTKLDGVTTDLSNGANFIAASGVEFKISYFAEYDTSTFQLSGGNDVALQVQSVPEPAAMSLIGLAAAGLLTRRRGRRV